MVSKSNQLRFIFAEHNLTLPAPRLPRRCRRWQAGELTLNLRQGTLSDIPAGCRQPDAGMNIVL